jgi:hypothetical protein
MVWKAYVLGDDEYGTWLYTPEGSRVVGRRGGVVSSSFVGIPDAPGLHVLQLVPADGGWWFGTWAVDHVAPRTAIDICTPPAFAEDEWSYVDLELDVYRRQDTVGIFDDDEFDEACQSGLISADERDVCLAAAAELDDRLRGSDRLLDEVVWDRLAAGVRLDVPALPDTPPR